MQNPEMNSKIEFFNQLDDRVMQNKQVKMPVIRSNTSVNSVAVKANSATQALLSFQTPYINPNMDVDRVLRIKGTMYFNCVCKNTAQIADGGHGLLNMAVVPGVNISPSSLPFHQGVASVTFNCNNGNVVNIPLGELKDLLQRISDYKENMKLQTGPSCVDYLTKYDDGYLTALNPLSNINDIDPMSGFIGNGTWDLQVGVNQAIGGRQGGGDIPAVAFTSAGLTWSNLSGLVDGGGVNLNINSNLYFTAKLTFDEALMVGPWIYNLCNAYTESAFTGISNFNFNFQMNTGSRCLRALNNAFTSSTITSVAFQTALFGSQAEVPSINYVLIDKPISYALERPIKPVYPFMNIIREVDTQNGLNAGYANKKQYTSRQINMTRVPRYIILGVRPNSVPQNYGDFLYALDDQSSPINITWCTVPGKCSTLTKKELFSISRKNGLQDPYVLWGGQSINKRQYVPAGTNPAVASVLVNGVGGWVILTPGLDFDIPIDQAPGSVGNFSMTVQMNVYNQSDLDQETGAVGINSSVNFYTWLVYDDVFEIDTVSQNCNVLTGLINPEIIMNVDKSKPAESFSESSGEVGGSLAHKFKAQHKANRKHVGAVEESAGKLSGGAVAHRFKRF